jgi:hypothetical protein
MSSKSREVIWGGAVMGANMHAKTAREEAQKAAREADRAEAYAWSVRMEGYGGPAQPSPTIGQCISGGYPNQTDALFGGAGGMPSLPGSAPPVCPKNFFASLWFCSATGRNGPKVVKLRTDAMARRS